MRMPVGDGVAEFLEELEQVVGRQGLLDRILRDRQRIRDVFHHEIRQLRPGHVAHAGGKDLGDARMPQLAEHLGFVSESPVGLSGDEARPHHLHCHGAFGLVLEPFVDPAHASLGDEPRDRRTADVLAEQWIAARDGGAGGIEANCFGQSPQARRGRGDGCSRDGFA